MHNSCIVHAGLMYTAHPMTFWVSITAIVLRLMLLYSSRVDWGALLKAMMMAHPGVIYALLCVMCNAP